MTVATYTGLQNLWADEREFRKNFDRSPFVLAHNLADSPLFEFPRLLRLAQFLKRDANHVVYDSGRIGVEDRWKYRPPQRYTLEEAMERIECTGSWVILKHTELDPDYRDLMEVFMSDVSELSGRDLRKETKALEAQIMLTSPGRITPYHIDNECNVLFQIRGEKDLYVFNQMDREVVTEVELERFWVGDWNAGEYKVRCQDRAHAFRLAPGKAVHIPVNAPHWVRNDDNVSVSLSVNFEWRRELVPNVYRANYFLRRMGMRPLPPGRSVKSDAMKDAVIRVGYVPLRRVARQGARLARRLGKHGHKKAESLPTV